MRTASGLIAFALFALAPMPSALPQPSGYSSATAMETAGDEKSQAECAITIRNPEKPRRAATGKYGERSVEFALANQLSALEIRIGIRSEQLNAWRDYAVALQAMLSLGTGKEFGENGANESDRSDRQKDPFDRELKLADKIIARAVIAQSLKAAITALRSILTQEQLQQLVLASRDGWLRIPRDTFGKTDLDDADHLPGDQASGHSVTPGAQQKCKQ